MTKVSDKGKTIIAKKGKNEKPSFSKTLVKTKKVKNAPVARVEIKNEVKSPEELPKKSDDKKKTTKNNSKVKESPASELECTKAHVEKCVSAIFKLAAKDEDKKSLLSDYDSPIFLQVNAVKVPETPRRMVRM